jgi:phage shock protein C
MFCTRCGTQLDEQACYCSQCGAATGKAESPTSTPRHARLSRPRENAKIAGVCAGVARYAGLDLSLVRILWLVLAIWPPGGGLLAYIICWIAMPKDPLRAPLQTAANQPA